MTNIGIGLKGNQELVCTLQSQINPSVYKKNGACVYVLKCNQMQNIVTYYL